MKFGYNFMRFPGFRDRALTLSYDDGTVHDKRLAEEFLKPTDPNRAWYVWPKLFYLWGHSYEFADNDNWEIIENFCEKVGKNDEVWYATNIEIYEYVKAFDNLVFSHDNSMVYNPSAQDVYLRFYKQNILVKAGQTLTLPIE